MDSLLLSRIQFGIAIGFHYLFPVTTLGLSFFIVIFETLHWVKKSALYRSVSTFLIKIFGLIFTVGVATGIMMPFSFGGNWARFSVYAGPVFGSALAIEAITAFALESSFLAVLLFGRKKVSPTLYWFSAVIVFIGTHLSAFLIVAANSWMQTPAGYLIQNDQIVIKNFMDVLFNPSTLMRFFHVLTAAWLVGAFLVAGIASWYAYRGMFNEFAVKVIRLTLPCALILSLLQPVLGHLHIMQVLKYNPEKDAAYEGIFQTVKGAPLFIFGISDAKNRRIRFAIGLPYVLSFLETGNPFSETKGLEEYPLENWPPVNIIFTTFHLMVMMGVIMIIASGFGVFLLWKKRVETTRWFLFLLPWMIPIPYLANELGWVGAEIGRQPWVIYKIMKTAQASTVQLPAWQIATTLGLLCLVYLMLLYTTLFFLRKEILKGPKME
ncbi:MAG: cytochrome ubiquinol oxidase subunit I [Chitinivibrionales bacterium]|nr:cytochrome ubiquinol oxidase subunit I [Chitinivibrionales bacterium]